MMGGSGKGDSLCKDPAVGVCLVCSRNNKEASISTASGGGGNSGEARRQGRGGNCRLGKVFLAFVKTFQIEEKEKPLQSFEERSNLI